MLRDYGRLPVGFWGRGAKALRGDAEAMAVCVYLYTSPLASMTGIFSWSRERSPSPLDAPKRSPPRHLAAYATRALRPTTPPRASSTSTAWPPSTSAPHCLPGTSVDGHRTRPRPVARASVRGALHGRAWHAFGLPKI